MKQKTIGDTREYLEEMAEELNALADMDQMEMYRMLTDVGNEIPTIPQEEKTDENFVQGCVSNVYVAESVEDGHIEFRGSSDAMVVRGYLSILIQALNGLSIRELLEESESLVSKFGEDTNIRANLTPSRANAFGNIYALMREKAKSAG
ncbi:SufE family protein [Salinispira pacifica]|uniref:Sulfur acceptor protein SufE for iron-sulfur cluster assembly n=1 Tax=Salinispira pacifica TaxID=1307761 RepID=V5WKJ7_9SPIO|nr:SufE family protein [Salinispira pacifica]AHC16064.1 Sulfur acceptor protein SufE for iron-sulfur cluster assembly [Salinispira pacifica]